MFSVLLLVFVFVVVVSFVVVVVLLLLLVIIVAISRVNVFFPLIYCRCCCHYAGAALAIVDAAAVVRTL